MECKHSLSNLKVCREVATVNSISHCYSRSSSLFAMFYKPHTHIDGDLGSCNIEDLGTYTYIRLITNPLSMSREDKHDLNCTVIN